MQSLDLAIDALSLYAYQTIVVAALCIFQQQEHAANSATEPGSLRHVGPTASR